ncbi:MAG TPA: hypothetical protein DCY82_15800 [Acidimicrobiaceae bacterium]|nr:hypothetical protein [Acidimicrobiales bacterium]HAY69720.1 hypothetical protein [Acidimicrobiaceae bacterium]
MTTGQRTQSGSGAAEPDDTSTGAARTPIVRRWLDTNVTTPTMVGMRVTAEETMHTVQAELAERFGIAHSTIQLKCHTYQDVAH